MAHSEMRWEIGVSASEIASSVFSNPNIFCARAESIRAAPSMDQPSADLPRYRPSANLISDKFRGVMTGIPRGKTNSKIPFDI
jgi:hypothetical protein